MSSKRLIMLPQWRWVAGEQETGVKVYVLRSLLPVNLRNFSKSVPTQLNQSLAMVIMSIITLAGGKMSEGRSSRSSDDRFL